MNSDHLEQVKELLEKLQTADAESLESLVEQIDVPDDVIREVRSLLKFSVPEDESTETEPADSADSNLPNFGSDYEAVRQLGRGGTSHVWLAKQKRDFERLVAIKIPRPALQLEPFRVLLRIEAQALARLTHPNIARVIDSGETSDGDLFLVVEYVEGPSLGEYCAGAQVPLDSILLLVNQMLRAIQQAHDVGIRHGDLSPQNIIVCTQDARPFARVIDFGLASGFNEPSSGGTGHFAAPEQQQPNSLIDNRADVFAVGKILEAVLQQRTDLQTDQDLAAVIAKATSNNAEQRYSSAFLFAEDLQRWQSHRPIHAQPPTRLRRLSLWMKRQPLAAASTVAAGLVMLVMSGAVVASWRHAVQQRKTAEANAAEALSSQQETESTLQLLEDWLAAPDPRRQGIDAKVIDLLEQADSLVDAAGPKSPMLALRVDLIRANTRIGLGDYSGAEVISNRIMAEQLWKQLDSRAMHRRVLEHRGNLLMRLHRYAEAEPILREAWEMSVQQQVDEMRIADSIRSIGNSLQQQGKLTESIEFYQLAIEELQPKFGTNSPAMARLQIDFAPALHRSGQRDEAEQMADEAVSLLESIRGKTDTNVINGWHNLGVLYMAGGKPERSEPILRDVLERRSQVLPASHPSLVGTEVMLGRVQLRIEGLESEGIKRLQRAYEVAVNNDQIEQPWLGLAADSVATALRDDAKFAEAIIWNERAVAANEQQFGPGHWKTASYRINLLRTQHASGDHESALEQLTKLIETLKEQLPDPHPVRRQAATLLKEWQDS